MPTRASLGAGASPPIKTNHRGLQNLSQQISRDSPNGISQNISEQTSKQANKHTHKQAHKASKLGSDGHERRALRDDGLDEPEARVLGLRFVRCSARASFWSGS